MVALSKVSWHYFRKANCADLVHPNTCTFNAMYQIYRFFLSNAKYYGLIVAVPTLAKFRNLNREQLMNALGYYVECVLTGTIMGWTTQVSVCILRNLLGEFKYYTILLLPTFIGGLTFIFSTPRVQRLYKTTIFTATIESSLLRRKNIFSRTVANSLLIQTLLFMTSSSIILQAKQSGVYKGFWLLTPDKNLKTTTEADISMNSEVLKEEKKKSCTHGYNNCTMHLIKGVRNYFAFGITLDIIKVLISSVPKGLNGFSKTFFAKLQNFKFNSAALLASYIGIYRFTYCYLNRRPNSNILTNHYTAGFLSGVCYIFMPKLTWLSYALYLAMQILWQDFIIQKSDHLSENKWWNIFLRFPYGKMLFPICLSHLIHFYCLHAKDVSNIAAIVINNTTDFYADNMLSRLNEMHTLVMAYR